MDKTELKDLVKKYFNLTETDEAPQTFADAELIDGTKVTNDKDAAFDVGDDLFVETEEGDKVKAPEGEHELKSGIVVVVDSEGKITGLRRPDEAGEGSLESSEEEMSDESSEETKETMMEPSAEVIEAIAELVMPEIEAMKQEMANCMEKVNKAEEKMKDVEDKMKDYMSETPASESKTASRFSKQTKLTNSNSLKYNQQRYEMTFS